MKQQETIVTIKCDVCKVKIRKPSIGACAAGYRVIITSKLRYGLNKAEIHLCETHGIELHTLAPIIQFKVPGLHIEITRLLYGDWRQDGQEHSDQD